MGKKVLLIIGSIVIVLAAAGGAFYGGMLYERQQAANLRAAFFADRGGGAGGGNGGGGGGFSFGDGNGAGNGAGRGAVGQIKSIDGDTITLSTAQSEVKVTLNDATLIQKTVAGGRTDLQVGERIVVRGERDSAGNVTATDIQIGGPAQGQGQ